NLISLVRFQRVADTALLNTLDRRGNVGPQVGNFEESDFAFVLLTSLRIGCGQSPEVRTAPNLRNKLRCTRFYLGFVLTGQRQKDFGQLNSFWFGELVFVRVE